jgi:tetrapyrrole methylase family protein/MazG family protein
MKPLPHINKTPENEEQWFATLVRLARYLRSPQGCPWDRKQTVQSFARFLAEEAQELDDAVKDNDHEHIIEEFGDMFFCALMTAAVAEDEGWFQLRDALEKAHEKMIRRHAHIFGEHTAETSDDAVRVWERVKAEEKKGRKKT